jgi:hypothetical protein
VETWDDKKITVVKSKGCVLGTVSPVPSGGAWDDQQEVDVTLKDISGYLQVWPPPLDSPSFGENYSGR